MAETQTAGNAKNIIKGKYVYLTGSGTGVDLFAYSTAHTLSMSAETEEVSFKNDGAGLWAKSTVSKLTWEVTSETFVAGTGVPKVGDPVYVTLYINSNATQNNTGSTVGGGTGVVNGNGIITSATLNANVGENATWSITVTGNGEIGASVTDESTTTSSGS